MPPPLISVKSAPRGGSVWSQNRSASTGSMQQDPQNIPQVNHSNPLGQSLTEGRSDAGGVSLVELPPSVIPAQQAPPSPQHSAHSMRATTPQHPPLPSTHSSPLNTAAIAPGAIPASQAEPRAPGSGVYVKRKVKKAPSAAGDTPQPSRVSPHRAGSESYTPRSTRSILRNPIARHSTVTFSADVAGLTMEQLDSVPVIKKSDVEQTTLRDEVFASLYGPTSSREQITVNITTDEDGQGVRIEGIIDHLRNSDEQNAVIRRLADFLHSPNVFGKSLAPFLALGGGLGSADRSLNDAAQRILVREARINDVPIKTVAPSKLSTGSPKSHVSVSTPQWDPDFASNGSAANVNPSSGAVDSSQAQTRYERRRKAYQSSLGIMYSSQLSIPTPHQGRWDRPQSEPHTIRPDPIEHVSPLPPSSMAGERGSLRVMETPRSFNGSMGNYGLPSGMVDSPTTPKRAGAGGFLSSRSNYADGSPAVAGGAAQYAYPGNNGERILHREAPSSGYGLLNKSNSSTPGVYRTRQYVTEDPRRRR